MMIRKVLFFLAVTISTLVVAQKPQRIGYIDMEYILENVPEYTDAQARLNVKVATWQQKLDGIKREIEVMKTDLSNEKPLLTQELISEREEDIQIREEDLRKLQAAYFGPKGDLFLLRKQLVKPVQDQIYNAVQNIAVRKKYDIVLDKSSDLIMLYANERFDVSELVLNSIVKGRKQVQLEEKKEQKQLDAETAIEAAKNKQDERASKRAQLEARVKAQQEAKAKIRADLKKAAEEKRKKRLEEIENRKNRLTNNKNKVVKSKTDSLSIEATDSLTMPKASAKATTKVTDSIRISKRAALLDRLEKQKEAKEKRKQELKKAAEEKRKKRLEELEKRKNAKKQQNNN